MSSQLLDGFDAIFSYCFRLFQDKNADYGPTWILYRYTSLNDELWRKAKRIRTLEEHADKACIPEGRDVEYVGIINYCIMFLMRLEENSCIPSAEALMEDLSKLDAVDENALFDAYQDNVRRARALLVKKNTDYGDAWKSMSLEAMTDQLIVRVFRIKKILANHGSCSVSEGIASQLYDMMNYCVFALIKMRAGIIFQGDPAAQ